MLGGTRDQIVNAVSNAWIDASLVAYRYAPNTGARKNWACGDASADAVRLAMMALKGDKGYLSILTAKNYGFYDARFGGKPFGMPQPFAEYVIQNSMFKLVAAGMHSQSAVECAFRLHPLVKDRIGEIERVEMNGSAPLLDVMGKTGPLYNADDRDHCAQYVVAVGLICGKLGPRELEDDFAADPRIDELRNKTVLTEDPRYTKDFYDPAKRSSANAVQVWFKDGSSTPKAEEQYPLGHQRRRAEAIPALRAKFEAALQRRFPAQQRDKILAACDDGAQLDRTAVHEFVELFVAAD
jgi:2-methylcitrate dehydratase